MAASRSRIWLFDPEVMIGRDLCVGPDTRLGLVDVMPKLCGFGGIDVNKKILLEYLKLIGSRITRYRQGVARGYVEGSS